MHTSSSTDREPPLRFLQVSIVTGAGSGIGLETSLLFASEGSHVILADLNAEAAQKAADLISQRYPDVRAIAVKCDVSSEADIESCVDRAVQEFGRLDVMFNNAGIMHGADDNALTTDEKVWDLTQKINVKGVWYGCKHAIKAMRKNPTDESKGLHVGGSVINTASFVGKMGAATPQIACEWNDDGFRAFKRSR